MYCKLKSRVAELRNRAGITQAQVAALVGVSITTVQNWEKENGLEGLERYLKLATILGCEVSELVEDVSAPEGKNSKTKSFSLEELRELRERWGIGTKISSEESLKNPNKSLGVDR